MRSLRLLAVSLLLVPLAAACGDGDEGGGRTVKFGYTADFAGAAALAAADRLGLWKKAGLKPKPKVFTNGPLQIQALGAGSLDFGYIGPGATWLPASGKAKIIAVNMLGEADRIIAAPKSGIKDIAGLRGKKVAVPEGTSGDMLLQLALKKAGMGPKDVERVPMDPSTVVTAFSSGKVDAAAIWYPLIDTIKKRTPDLVELSKNADFFPAMSFPSSFVARNEIAKDDPETTRKVVKVLQQANDWVHGHTAEAEQTAAKFLKVPPAQFKGSSAVTKTFTSAELVRYSGDGTVNGWFKGLSDIFVAMGKLPSSPDPATYYTAGLYTNAAAGK
ncbi:aliphatic sulfonate ABC transporter substrate-binding protein [Actinomadura nitritigenes]|uniref:aliphatic sulfonate ABC transporter substrate-binding protein n=1 Tax=Actinomadura nitritigenes TaxID=134602 RepID=UPI003D904C85